MDYTVFFLVKIDGSDIFAVHLFVVPPLVFCEARRERGGEDENNFDIVRI